MRHPSEVADVVEPSNQDWVSFTGLDPEMTGTSGYSGNRPSLQLNWLPNHVPPPFLTNLFSKPVNSVRWLDVWPEGVDHDVAPACVAATQATAARISFIASLVSRRAAMREVLFDQRRVLIFERLADP